MHRPAFDEFFAWWLMQQVLEMNYEADFAAANAKAGAGSFSFRTGPSSMISVWSFSSCDAWLGFNAEMGAKLSGTAPGGV
jgi:hypothetical protein